MLKKAVGFDQKILLKHLDFVARELPRTDQPQELYEKTDMFLAADIAGAKARKNARTILFKIWVHVEEEHLKLRDEALNLCNHTLPEERKAIHWGLTMLAYPFFADVVSELGTLLRIHREVPSAQLHRQIKARYGDRRRVEVSVDAALTTLRDWGMILSSRRGFQTFPPERIPIRSPEIKQWLSEALLRVTGVSSLPLEMLQDHPLLFPFQMDISSADLDLDRFHIIRQGVNQRVVALKS